MSDEEFNRRMGIASDAERPLSLVDGDPHAEDLAAGDADDEADPKPEPVPVSEPQSEVQEQEASAARFTELELDDDDWE